MPNEFVVLGIITTWLLALTISLFLLLRFFKRLIRGTKEADLKKVLERVLNAHDKNLRAVRVLEKEIKRLEEEGYLHVQKVGLVRFNPFKEIGGDHSFSLSLLDGTNTGLVITVLHTRERTRIYAKMINKGKSELSLSKEEKMALEKVQKNR